MASFDQNQNLKILTYNIGLLDFTLFGFTVYSNPPYSEKRLRFIPEAIRHHEPDIVCLQECYSERHVEYLIFALIDLYPYCARQNSGDLVRLHNGLLILSKFPVVSSKLIQYKEVSTLEYYLASKSSLFCALEIPRFGILGLVNMHTTAGGENDPESIIADQHRQSEIIQSLDYLKIAENKYNQIGMIVGDLNCGPTTSFSNYNYFLNQGYRDTVTESLIANNFVSKHQISWDPLNFLNIKGPHSHTPPQLIDHVLLSASSHWNDWEVAKGQIVFTEEVVPISLTEKSTISDHYGVLIELKRKF